jgi:hypothetical protein
MSCWMDVHNVRTLLSEAQFADVLAGRFHALPSLDEPHLSCTSGMLARTSLAASAAKWAGEVRVCVLIMALRPCSLFSRLHQPP